MLGALSLVLKFAPLAFSALLPLINPVGSAILFMGLVGEAPPELYKQLARSVAKNTALLLLAVDLLGAVVLNFFGISLPVVQLAGGAVIAALGWNMLNAKDESKAKSQPTPEARPLAELQASLFYPFTFPLTAGPGTIVVTLALSAHASEHVWKHDALAHAGILVGNLAMCVLIYVCYGYAPAIARKISRQTLNGILRIIAFVLLCIGVQIAWNGLEGLVKTLKA